MRKHVISAAAPRPIGPYSQGVMAGGFMFVSGQIPLDPQTNELVGGGIEAQTEQVLKNLLAVLKEAKMGAEHVVKTTVFLSDLKDFAKMNEVFAARFGAHRPARSTVAVAALPAGARVEIDLVVRVG